MTTPIIIGHIHLAATLGSAPENAPIYSWPIVDRDEVPVTIVNFRRSITGAAILGVLSDSNGNPIHLTNFRYRVKIDDRDGLTYVQRRDALKSLFGQRLYLVDSLHCADGTDHTSFVRSMICTDVGKFPKDDILLRWSFVDVELEDDSIGGGL